MIKSKCRTILVGMLAALGAIISFQPANAVQQVSFSSGISYDGYYSGFSSGQTSRLLPAEYSRTNQQVVYLTPSTLSADEFANNKDIYLSGNIIFNVDYITSATPRPVNMSCPIFNDWVLTSEANCDMQDIVYGNSHYLVYSFQLKGITRNANNIINSKTIVIKFDIKNMSEREANMWFTPVIVSAGGGDYNRLVGINTSIDNAIGTLGVINNNILSQTSAINQLQTSANNIFNRLGNIESKVSDIYDRIGNIENNSNAERSAAEDATENIENQSTSDSAYSESTNQQTTSLINAFGGFVSAIGNIRATSCDLSLPLPNFMGGTRTVNACTAKTDGGSDVITIINVASSIMAIIFYIPFALMMINLIYKEIRSFTN